MPPDLQFADGILARLHARSGKRFDERAYFFVLAAIEYLQTRLDVRRHVTGPELAWACRDLALERFGLLARTVLEHWGIASTADIGRVVFTLVDEELLATQPTDHETDFAGVFEFPVAFEQCYTMRWSGQ